MNKFKYIFIVLAVMGMTLYSCQEKLELQPENSLSKKLVFESGATTKAALQGVYSLASDIHVFGSIPQTINDYMADNVKFVGSFPTFQEVYQFSILADNGSLEEVWQFHYKTINAANTVIGKTPSVLDKDNTFTQAEADQIIAEAKFMRALVYLQLVNLFAQPYSYDQGASLGVPLVLKGFDGEIINPARATVAQVYDQIIKDLTEASKVLPSIAAGAPRYTATYEAAQGLLSRVYLYQERWQDAVDAVKNAMSNGALALAADYTFYDKYSPEQVFSIAMSPIDNSRTGTGGWAEYYNPTEAGGRGDCPFSTDLANAYDPNDLRYTTLSDSGTAANNLVELFTTKFPHSATNEDDAPVIRTTELVLNKTEALVQLNGVNQKSVDILNQLLIRAGLSTVVMSDFASKQELLDRIFSERRKEMAFEGHRRVDLLRTGRFLRSSGPGSDITAGSEKAILPIPQRELDINPNLVQNPGY